MELRGKYRMTGLQYTLKAIAEKLNNPNLLPDLMEEFSTKKFFATAPI